MFCVTASFSLLLSLLALIPGLGPRLVLTAQSVPHSPAPASIAATAHAVTNIVTRTVTNVVTRTVTKIVPQVTHLMSNDGNNNHKLTVPNF